MQLTLPVTPKVPPSRAGWAVSLEVLCSEIKEPLAAEDRDQVTWFTRRNCKRTCISQKLLFWRAPPYGRTGTTLRSSCSAKETSPKQGTKMPVVPWREGHSRHVKANWISAWPPIFPSHPGDDTEGSGFPPSQPAGVPQAVEARPAWDCAAAN